MKSYSPFEPSEITGRSTLRVPVASEENKNVSLSLEEILSSSCCDEVRGMRDSLVKTADLSSISEKSFWNLSNLSNNISIAPVVTENVSFFGEFRSGESAPLFLKADEVEWENEKGPLPNHDEVSIRTTDNYNVNTSKTTNDPLSMSNFFQKMSDENIDILFVPSPTKRRKPEPLIDVTNSKQFAFIYNMYIIMHGMISIIFFKS